MGSTGTLIEEQEKTTPQLNTNIAVCSGHVCSNSLANKFRSVVLQYYSTTVLQYYSTTVLQYYSTTVLQYYSTTSTTSTTVIDSLRIKMLRFALDELNWCSAAILTGMVLNSIDEEGGCVRRLDEFVDLNCIPSTPPKLLQADSEYDEPVLNLNGNHHAIL
mgnify:CR=1 FL=1